MSDSKRATFITVGAAKSEKNKVHKTVRLAISLEESNESKYPELNYKELVIAEENKLRLVENGKTDGQTDGLNPYSDNDEDVQRVAKKFEQKYGSNNSSYGKKNRRTQDDFADIGAGYDENDSFIDNTDGYDEMIPPECDTLYGGFYINCGSLQFRNNPEYPHGEAVHRNKRRISSSSSSSSDSSDGSDSADGKDMLNGDPQHKSNNLEKKKAKKIRRTDSSAATSGKQTSDDNGHADSGESRTSQSDSVTSKPAPSSENAATSDSSRDVESRPFEMSPAVASILGEMEAAVAQQAAQPGATTRQLESTTETFLARLDTLKNVTNSDKDGALSRAARCLRANTAALHRAKERRVNTELYSDHEIKEEMVIGPTEVAQPKSSTASEARPSSSHHNHYHRSHHAHKRKAPDDETASMSDEEREANIVATLARLKALIEERKPGMIATYNAECERVQEERKKIQIASASGGGPHIEKRLPKRRFPWCQRSRSLLCRLTTLAGSPDQAALLLAKRALPLFPNGFVRMPTLLRQADLNKELKVSELKRQKFGSASLPLQTTSVASQRASKSDNPVQFVEQFPKSDNPIHKSDNSVQFPKSVSSVQCPNTDNFIQFPKSLTVTATKSSPEKTDDPKSSKTDHISFGNEKSDDLKPYKTDNSSIFGSILNNFTLSKELVVEKHDDRNTVIVDDTNDAYIPPSNIGSITITPVPNNVKEKRSTATETEPLLRIKSPAALNEMVNKEKEKALDNIHKRDKDKKRDKESYKGTDSKERKDCVVKEPILFKDLLLQPHVKESTIQVKHTYVKDIPPVNSNSLVRESHSHAKEIYQNKDQNSLVKDAHSQYVKDIQQVKNRDKDTQFVKDIHVKDRMKDTNSMKDSHSQKDISHKDSRIKESEPQFFKDYKNIQNSLSQKDLNLNKDPSFRHKDSQNKDLSSRHKDSHSSLKDVHFKDKQRHKDNLPRPKDDNSEARIKEILSQIKDIPVQLKDLSHKDIPLLSHKDIPHVGKDVPSQVKEKRVHSPLHIETNFQGKNAHSPRGKDMGISTQSKNALSPNFEAKNTLSPNIAANVQPKNTLSPNITANLQAKSHSPKTKDNITKKQIETMRVAENNIPRPALVPVHHSPTFVKPDKRPERPESKKKDISIISDQDPLQHETVAIDDSSSDVEVIEDTSGVKNSDANAVNNSDSNAAKHSDSSTVKNSHTSAVKSSEKHSDLHSEKHSVGSDKNNGERSECDTTKEDFDSLMKNIRDLEHSQESSKVNSSSFGVITNERTSLNKMDGGSNTGEASRQNVPPS